MVLKLVTPDTMSNTTSELFASNTTGTLGLGDATSITSQNVTGNMSVPDGCLVVRLEKMEFLPWDNPDNVVSAEVEHIARRVKDNMLFFLFLIGGPANVINLAVFYKQGLKERVNLCLFALSLADVIFLVQSMCFFGEQIHLQFTTKEIFGPVMRFMFNNNLVGFFGFSWVSEVLSAIIASERCLCVLSPLRFQTLLRTRTMAVIIVVVFLVVVGFYFVMATRYRIACVFVPPAGTTWSFVPSEFYRKRELLINYLDGFVYGAGIPVVMITVVTTTTIITAVKVRQAAAWRAGTSSASGSSSSSSSSISPQELALTRMLIGISVLFIVCVAPLALFRVVWLFQPEMNLGRRYHNLFATGLSVLETLAYVNATFNIFVYYSIGTRYRKTFWALLGRLKQDKTERMPGITN